MIKTFCDRCGKETTNVETTNLEMRSVKEKYEIPSIVIGFTDGTGIWTQSTPDLCKECRQELLDWYHKKL